MKYGHEKHFFDPVTRQKLKTMEDANKTVSLSTSKGKLIQYKEQRDLAFKLLVKSQMLSAPVDLDVLLTYPLSPVPHCLGTPDGFFAKTNKASIVHFLMEDHNDEVQYPNGSMFIQDGNAVFHTLANLPPTFGGICLQILDHMVAKRSFIFSTDSYHPDSLKTQERLRRGCGDQFILEGSATRTPKDFKAFLSNDANKKQLCEVLLKVWSSSAAASRLEKCTDSVLIVDGIAYGLQYFNKQVRNPDYFNFTSLLLFIAYLSLRIMTINYIIIFFLLGKCAGNTFYHIQPRRD